MLHTACMHSLCLPRLVLVPWLDLTGGGQQDTRPDRVDTLIHTLSVSDGAATVTSISLCSSADIVVDQR